MAGTLRKAGLTFATQGRSDSVVSRRQGNYATSATDPNGIEVKTYPSSAWINAILLKDSDGQHPCAAHRRALL
jgi:hypothetical protein